MRCGALVFPTVSDLRTYPCKVDGNMLVKLLYSFGARRDTSDMTYSRGQRQSYMRKP